MLVWVKRVWRCRERRCPQVNCSEASEQLACFATGGLSNGPTEATNLLIEKVRRVGHGYRNLDNYRLRLLLYCAVDWQIPVTTPIRGRLPRLVA
ncbi:MAG TPA: transposase [Candidatus Dormibacteraeota bacterium]